MARKRRKPAELASELPLTPMIDVVFQLLIYFIVTIKPIDIFAHLEVSRPSPEDRKERAEIPNLLRINIFKEGYTFNDRPVSTTELERLLARAASLQKDQHLLIMASTHSEHSQLIAVLDLCAKYELTKLSVISTN